MSYQHIPTSFTDTTKDIPVETTFEGTSGMETAHESSLGELFSSNMSVQMKLMTLARLTRNRVTVLVNQLRPWSEFFDRTYFAAPEGAGDAIGRLTTNGRYFYPNYFLLSLICSSYVLLINASFSLCLIGVLMVYYYIQSEVATLMARGNYTGMITACGQTMSTFQLYIGLAVFSLISFYFTNGSSVVFWLVLTTLGVVAPHAIYRRPALADPAFQFA